ncbi:MAG TPA: sigma-70 family RNA polymerase sigma factor [Exilispira sp.]|nr:sigma-70 family RNA polymerase sigma factor [Exilispira sp.]
MEKAKNKNKDALEKLYQKYDLYITKLVLIFANKANLTNEIDDLKAEANIAFLNAVDTYNPDLKVHFSVYLRNIIKNRLLNYLKVRKKLDGVNCQSIYDINIFEINDKNEETFDLFAFEFTIFEKLKKIMSKFSPLESQVFSCYINNMKPSQISALLNLSKKSCENAISRVKGKFLNELEEQEVFILMRYNNFREIIRQIFEDSGEK